MSANNEDLKKVTQRRRPHGPGARMMPGEKAKDFKGSISKLVRFMGQFKAALVLAIIFAIGSAAFNIVGPKVLSQATTELFEGLVAKVGGTGGIDFDAIAGIIAATLVLYLVSAACGFVQGWMMTSVSQRTCYGLRRAIAEKIDRMPVGYFERNSTGDTLSRITNDVDTLGQSLNQGVTQLITSATTIVGVVIMMLTINPLLTGITVLILPVSLVLVFTVVKASQKHFRAQQAMLGAINGQVEETFSGHAIVRAFNREQAVAETFGKTNAKLYESAWKSQFLVGLDAAHHELRGQPGLCGRGVGRQRAGRAGRHHRRRHPGVHPVREELHAAHHAAVAGGQRAAADGRGRRAHLRVPGGARA